MESNNERALNALIKFLADFDYTMELNPEYEATYDYPEVIIKELPKWRCGIWWSEPKNEDNSEGTFFMQYADTVDKFKPSRSGYTCSVFINFKYDDVIFDTGMLDFIRKHPLRAWYRDFTWADYNTKYVSSFTIVSKYIGYKYHKTVESIITPILNKKYSSKLCELWCDETAAEHEMYGWKMGMIDRGKGWWPRYEVQVEMPDYNPEIQETGLYGLCNDNQKKLDDYRTKLDKVAQLFGVWWYPDWSDSAAFWNKEEHKKYFASLDEENKEEEE